MNKKLFRGIQMFKNLKLLFIILIFPFLIMDCKSNSLEDNVKISLGISKPSINFYTDNLLKIIDKYPDIHVSIFYSKTGKNKTIPKDYMERFNLFMESIKPTFFVNTNNTNLELKDPEYRITLYIEEKPIYLINIFNEKYISIHPWDGSYPPDIIDISPIHERINIYNLCDYIIKNNIEK